MLKKFYKSIFFFMLLFSNFSTFATCLKEGDKVNLTGIVIEKLYYGPPDWGEDKAHDEKLYEWILHLKQPITCVTDLDSDKQNWNRDIQLIMRNSNDYKDKKKLIGKMVSVNGVILLAETGYHMTPVLLDDAFFQSSDREE